MSLVEAFSFFICFLDERLGANSEQSSLLLIKKKKNPVPDLKLSWQLQTVASYKYLKWAINFQY